MVTEFIEEYAKLIVDKSDKLKVSIESVNPTFSIITIYADKSDTGRLIGKDGKMISSLKTIISGCKAKNGISYKIVVTPNEQ